MMDAACRKTVLSVKLAVSDAAKGHSLAQESARRARVVPIARASQALDWSK
jgi:hypothetical protein